MTTKRFPLFPFAFFLFLTLTVLVWFYRYYRYHLTTIDLTYQNPRPMKCCILLTMFINQDDARRQMYLHRLGRWLGESGMDIYTVNSSGETLPVQHPRLRQFAFRQPEGFAKNSTLSESYSILRACEYFHEDFSRYDLIFKVTGKYFIPSLERITRSIPSDTQLLFQSRFYASVQHTEITGYTPDLLYHVTRHIHKHSGEIIYERQIEPFGRVLRTYRLPQMPLEDFTARGDGNVLEFL